MHSKCIWSLNHDITTSYGLNHTPIFLKSILIWHKSNTCVRVDLCAHPQHIKVVKQFIFM